MIWYIQRKEKSMLRYVWTEWIQHETSKMILTKVLFIEYYDKQVEVRRSHERTRELANVVLMTDYLY